MIVSYNWLKDYLGPKAPTPTEIEALLTFHAFEVESIEALGEDTLIDVKILPDRSSDCLSHRGIAREIATLTGTPLAHDPLASVPQFAATDAIMVDIKDADLCPRFTASLVTDITVGPSPAWLVERLAALGQRSVNNIVDATNYVMYAIGQPLHAYDADTFPSVDGAWRFTVRPAVAGETVSLLPEGTKTEDRIVTLEGGELLIIDGATDTPIGLAGVKGGRYAGVTAATKNIIIEAAHFNPARTRKTARALGIVIDASKRFENEPSRALPLYAQAEIIKLITDIAGGKAAGLIDVYPKPVTNPEVILSPVHVNALLGLTLDVDTIVTLLHRVGVTVTKNDNLTLTCVGPFERTDLQIPEDFIDEIGRVYGYHHIMPVVPETVPLRELNARQYYVERVRNALVAEGLSEVITTSFVKKAPVRLISSLASDKTCLRACLQPNIAEVLDKNAGFVDLLGIADVRVFEFGAVFAEAPAGVTEHVALALGVRLKQTGYSGKEDAILKQLTAVVDTALGTKIEWQFTKGVAECNFDAVVAALPAPTAYEPFMPTAAVTYQPFSIYPAVTRDIAMWVGETTEVAAVIDVLNAAAGPLRVRTTHVDAFTKDGRTSFAFRLVFQAMDRTLTDDEVNAVMDGVYQAATEEGWETR